MESIQISTGVVRLPIIRDDVNYGYLVFNPNDLLFAEKFYAAMHEFEIRSAEYRRRAEEIDANAEKDKDGKPILSKDGVAFLVDFCRENYATIDKVFGEGTSAKLFGETLNFDFVFDQFFKQIGKYFKKARAEKVKGYIPQSQKPPRRTRRK